MNAETVERILAQELSSGVAFDNAHGITSENIDQYRVRPPMRRRFEYAGGTGEEAFVDAWVVLDECPGSINSGYFVVFHPPPAVFGLAVKGTPYPIFLGWYGSLADTLSAM